MIGIKNMYMPERCAKCPFYSGVSGGTCLVIADGYNSYTMYDQEYERQDWCPLIEIEESGEKNETF